MWTDKKIAASPREHRLSTTTIPGTLLNTVCGHGSFGVQQFRDSKGQSVVGTGDIALLSSARETGRAEFGGSASEVGGCPLVHGRKRACEKVNRQQGSERYTRPAGTVTN